MILYIIILALLVIIGVLAGYIIGKKSTGKKDNKEVTVNSDVGEIKIKGDLAEMMIEVPINKGTYKFTVENNHIIECTSDTGIKANYVDDEEGEF